MREEPFDVNVIYSDPERPIAFGSCADIRMLSCHLTPIASGLEIQEHEHSHWELSFMVNGEMKTFCDEHTIFCEEKNTTILLIPPGTLHHRKFGKNDRNCNFTIEFLLNHTDDVHNLEQQCVSHGFQFTPEKFLKSLLEEIRLLSKKNIDEPDWMLAWFSQVFMLTFLRNILNVTAARRTEAPPDWKFRQNRSRAKDIFRFLNTHIADKHVLQELSTFFSLSQRQLNRIFESEYHKTLSAAIDDIRFKRAILLLQDNTQTIREIAEETGFVSPAGFYLFFRRHTERSPQSFRRMEVIGQ